MLFADPLLVLDWHGRPVARLATGSEWQDDGLTLKVRLQPGVKFHDGTTLTARVVADILRQQMHPKKQDSVRFRYVKAIETPDDHTVLFRLSQPDGFLVEAIAGTPMVDETKPDIGTGPFRIVSRDKVIVVEKNDAYYRGLPGIDGVQITTYDTPRTAWAAMMRGEVDMVQEVNRDSVEFLEGASRFELYTSLRPFYMPLVFNLRHPILSRLEVRRALAVAIDRDEILREVLRGHGTVADDPIWPNHWAYNPAGRKYTHDPAAARAALDAAGLPVRPASVPGAMDSRFRIGCVFWEKGSQYERTALLLQRQLAEVGVDLALERADQKTLITRAGRGEFDTYVFQLASGKAFDIAYRFWRSGPGQYQNTGYTGADAALDRLRLARTDADVRVAVAELRQRFFEDVPAAFLVWPETTRAVDSRFDVGDRSDPEFFANLWRWKPARRPERLAVRRITSRFVLLIATAAVLPLVVYGLVSVRSLRTGTEESVGQGNQAVARQIAARIEEYFQNNRRVLASLGAELRGTQLEAWQEAHVLRNHVLDFREFGEISVFDGAGRLRATSRIGSSTLTIPESIGLTGQGKDTFHVATPYIDADALPTTTIAVPLVGGGEDPGWIVASISLEQLWRTVDRIKVGTDGYALLMDEQAKLLAHGNPDDKGLIANGATATASRAGARRRRPAGSVVRQSDVLQQPAREAPGGRGRGRQPGVDRHRGAADRGRVHDRARARAAAALRHRPRAARHGGARLALGPVVHPAHLRAHESHAGPRRRGAWTSASRCRAGTRSSSSATRSTRWPIASWSCRRTSASRSARRCSAASPPAWSTTSRTRSRTSATAAS